MLPEVARRESFDWMRAQDFWKDMTLDEQGDWLRWRENCAMGWEDPHCWQETEGCAMFGEDPVADMRLARVLKSSPGVRQPPADVLEACQGIEAQAGEPSKTFSDASKEF